MVGHVSDDPGLDRAPYRDADDHGSFNRNGWFVGGGVENNLNIFGITAPGWFMKTEYRSAFYDRISLPTTLVRAVRAPAVGPTGTASPSSPGTRPSAPRWSTASTGAARRSGEVLILLNSSRKAPASSGAFLLPSIRRPHGAAISCWLWPRMSDPSSPHERPVIEIRLAGHPDIVFDRQPADARCDGFRFRQGRAPQRRDREEMHEPIASDPRPDRACHWAALDRPGHGHVAWPRSSFMINQSQWAGYGAALGAVGLILIWQSKR